MTGTEQFIASLVHALAWPGAVVGLAVVFRAQLSKLVDRPLSRLRAGPAGLEFVFERVTADVEADLETAQEQAPEWASRVTAGTAGAPETHGEVKAELRGLAQTSPTTAILSAFKHIELRLQELLKDKIKFPSALTATALADSALSQGLITNESHNAVRGVLVLRDLAAHSPAEVSTDKALEYLALVDGVLYSLERPPKD